ncbi:MAG: NUDIX domain-containing protein, partial [bacterium]|nr:NUDIX domain-containing protein [bacterium]
MPRGAVILIQNNRIALIKRVRENEEYFLIPGGQVEEGETIEEAAIRETREELGLHIQLGPLAAIVEFPSRPNRTQYYYWAQITGGKFGTGDGAELKSAPTTHTNSAASGSSPKLVTTSPAPSTKPADSMKKPSSKISILKATPFYASLFHKN